MSAVVMEPTNKNYESTASTISVGPHVDDLIEQFEELDEMKQKNFTRHVLRKVLSGLKQKVAVRDESNALLGYLVPTPAVSSDDLQAVNSGVPEYQPNGKPKMTQRELINEIGKKFPT